MFWAAGTMFEDALRLDGYALLCQYVPIEIYDAIMGD
jgi:hypothetical protein